MKNEDIGKNLEKMLGGLPGVKEAMETIRKDLAHLRVTGAAGGGLVQVVVNGERKVVSVTIDEQAMADRDMLQDLIAGAVTDAMNKIESAMQEKISSAFSAQLMGKLFQM